MRFPPVGFIQVGVIVVPDAPSIPRNRAMVINAAIDRHGGRRALLHCPAPGCSLPALLCQRPKPTFGSRLPPARASAVDSIKDNS
jgi:hypothetical protein